MEWVDGCELLDCYDYLDCEAFGYSCGSCSGDNNYPDPFGWCALANPSYDCTAHSECDWLEEMWNDMFKELGYDPPKLP